jgi:hypothetical protein
VPDLLRSWPPFLTDDSDEVREDSPEEGQIEVEPPKKKRKKMRPAKLRRMQARQAELDLINSVVTERGPGSPAGIERQGEKEGSQRTVLNTGRGLVGVSSGAKKAGLPGDRER